MAAPKNFPICVSLTSCKWDAGWDGRVAEDTWGSGFRL